MQIQNFDEIIKRENTDCVKFDGIKRYFGKDDVQPLWVADMDFKTPKFIVNDIQKKVSQELYAYPEPNEKVFESIQSWMKKRHNWNIETSNITLVCGVVASLSAAVEAYSDVGDEVIIQPPVYYPFFSVVKHNDRKLIENPLISLNGDYKMDLEDLKAKITDKTKILILCSPHNPVGRVWDKEELEALANICLSNNIKIISDEIHSDIVFKKFTPLASISNEIANITLTLNSPSKTFNLAGLNSSYAICSNKKMQQQFKKIVIKREIGSLNIFGLVTLQSSYEQGEKWVEQLLLYLKSNILFTKKFFKDNDIEVNFKNPESTYLLWLNFKSYNFTHEKIKEKLLEEAKIALNDGLSFGSNGEFFFRLNLALPQSQLKNALIKIHQSFKIEEEISQ